MKFHIKQGLFILALVILSVSVVAIPTGYSPGSYYRLPTFVGSFKQVGDLFWSTSATGMAVEKSTSETSETKGTVPSPINTGDDRIGEARKTAPSGPSGGESPGTRVVEPIIVDTFRTKSGKAGETSPSAGKGCTPNWVYSAWSPCSSSGMQLRKVYDSNNCGTPAPTDITQPCSSICASVVQPCTVGVGACAHSGTQTRTCVNGVLGVPSACSATPGNPTAEICGNPIDENCNGQTNENCPPACTPVTQSCQVGFGQCARTGTQTTYCYNGAPGTPSPCSATPGTPNPEICNNIDDNCDGIVDEVCSNPPGHHCTGWSSCASENCVNGFCGTYQDCINACQTCQQSGPFGGQQCTTNWACAQSCHATCIPVSDPCTVGVGACARPGTQTRSCANNLLGSPSACSAISGTPAPEICYNNIDENCNGQTDEGCLKQNGQLCSQGSECLSGNCVFYQAMGICKSYQDCIAGCQNCQTVCSGPFSCSQQCTTNGACAQNCH